MRANPNDTFAVSRGFVRADEQLFVTIGRNVGPDPLSDAGWRRFVADVTDQLGALIHPSATFGPFFGTGEWEGVTEESAVLSFTVGYTSRVEDVESVLSTLAEQYGQDAIAWTHGAGRLAER